MADNTKLVDINGLAVFLDEVRSETDEKIAKAGIGVLYTISKNENGEIVLSGTDGSSTTVDDENTTYTFSENNHVLTITGTDGTSEEIQLGGEVTKQAVIDALGFTPMEEYTEIDPTVPSHVKNITETDISNWNDKAEVGDIPNVPAWALASEKPSYTAEEVGALPSTTTIPSSLSDLTDDATHRVVTDSEKTAWNNKLDSFTETDPTVPSHVKSITSTDITNWNNKAESSDIPDVSGFALTSESGYDLGLSIDSKTYVMTLELKNKAGTVISTKTLDFPIESMVVDASYKDGIITLTLQSGSTLPVDISALVGGLVNDSFTIAGIDMKDDITAAELKTALGVPSTFAPTDAQANVIETIKVNNTALTPTSKAVNITVPTQASDIGAMASTVTHLSGDVPTTRTINGKALSADITLSASDVNALPSSTSIPTITDTYSSTSSNGMSGKAVASAISGKANSSDIPAAETTNIDFSKEW